MTAGAVAPPRRRRDSRASRRGEGDEVPPEDGDGGRGSGGGDGSDGGSGGFDRESRARLGLALAIFGMSTLFAAFLLAYLLLRRNAAVWPPPGAPIPPRGLWASTLVLLASSATISAAVRAADAGARTLANRLVATLALGFLFLAVQAVLWREVLTGGRFAFSDAYGTIFYSLTGLHAAHVVGGLLFVGRVLGRARREPASPRTRLQVRLCATYWHFMDAVWVVLFVVLTFLS